jgi:hypothetical protein
MLPSQPHNQKFVLISDLKESLSYTKLVELFRVLGYRSRGPGSIPGTTRKRSNGSGTGSTQPREELFDRKVAAPV